MRKLLVAVAASCAAVPAWASEGAAETFLGLPAWLWKTANLLAFFGLLVYLLAKPMRSFFAARKETIARQLDEAVRQRQEAARLSSEMEGRVASLQGEIRALQDRLRDEGEREREALIKQGEAEAARFVAQMDQEATRRADEARTRLAREAADAAAEMAWQLLEREVTDADRERIFSATLERLRSTPGGGR